MVHKMIWCKTSKRVPTNLNLISSANFRQMPKSFKSCAPDPMPVCITLQSFIVRCSWNVCNSRFLKMTPYISSRTQQVSSGGALDLSNSKSKQNQLMYILLLAFHCGCLAACFLLWAPLSQWLYKRDTVLDLPATISQIELVLQSRDRNESADMAAIFSWLLSAN